SMVVFARLKKLPVAERAAVLQALRDEAAEDEVVLELASLRLEIEGRPAPEPTTPVGLPILFKGSESVGPFTVERLLGRGGMGAVYLAHFKDKPNMRVALKFVMFGLSATALNRFEGEADILKQLKHPNIVRLIGHGRHRKTIPYYA